MTVMTNDYRTKSGALPDGAADAIELLLRGQLAVYQQLLQCIDRKRQAIRTADLDAITTICGEENSHIQGLAELERRRLELIGRLTQAVTPGAKKPLTINELTNHLAEPQRARTAAIAAQLREALGEVRSRSAVVRQAAETLSRHMSGIVQTVHSALSRARVYGQRGRISPGASIPSMVDLKS